MRWQLRRPLDDSDLPVRLERKDRRIQTQQLAPPPVAGLPLLPHRREPVLPEHRADILGRSAGERVAPEERENIPAVGEQPLLSKRDKGVLLPVAQRGEPQVPVEPRLIRRIDTRSLIEGLRLIPEGV